MTAAIPFVAAGLISWLLRASFITLLGDRKLPDSFERAIAGARPAVLAALIATSLVGMGGSPVGVLTSPFLPAAVGTIAVAWLSRSPLVTLASGLALVVGLQSVWPS